MTTDKKISPTKMVIPAVLTMILGSTQVSASVGMPVYDNIPAPLPPNVPSLGYEATSTAEFGGYIQLAGTNRTAGTVTVTMSDWARHSDYPLMDSAGYIQPITLNIYTVTGTNPPVTGTKIGTITQSFLIPWRPEGDSSCPDTGYGSGFAWRASDGKCYNGYAFTIAFDLRSLALTLPDKLIFGIAYNTTDWGYNPTGQSGPYDSLNVGTSAIEPPYVGSDVNPDAVFWNTSYGPFYADGGAGGVGTFRMDTNWSGYLPAVQFDAFKVATTTNACKNNGWQSLSMSDGSPFKNQGDCVSWVNNPNKPVTGGGNGKKANLMAP